MRKLFFCIVCLVMFSAVHAAHASVVALMMEDFNEAAAVEDPLIKQGVPTMAMGADNDWTGARFQTGTSTIASDAAMQRIVDDLNYFGQVEDGAAILMRLTTKDHENAKLGFDWRTSSSSGEDRFVAGYYEGFEASPDWANWTELLAGASRTTWASELFDLPADTEDLWVAFWMKAGEGDYGWVDNISVNAEQVSQGEPSPGDTVVPEPISLVLLGAGLLLVRRRS